MSATAVEQIVECQCGMRKPIFDRNHHQLDQRFESEMVVVCGQEAMAFALSRVRLHSLVSHASCNVKSKPVWMTSGCRVLDYDKHRIFTVKGWSALPGGLIVPLTEDSGAFLDLFENLNLGSDGRHTWTGTERSALHWQLRLRATCELEISKSSQPEPMATSCLHRIYSWMQIKGEAAVTHTSSPSYQQRALTGRNGTPPCQPPCHVTNNPRVSRYTVHGIMLVRVIHTAPAQHFRPNIHGVLTNVNQPGGQ
jgi:hypothetical protein